MDDDTLEAYVRHYIAASETQNEVAFTGRAANQRYSGWILPPCRGATGEIWCWQEDK